VNKEPSHEEKKSSNFYKYHRSRSHHAMNCYTLRAIFHKKVSNGEIRFRDKKMAQGEGNIKDKGVVMMFEEILQKDGEKTVEVENGEIRVEGVSHEVQSMMAEMEKVPPKQLESL
jgi:hypothetical protein